MRLASQILLLGISGTLALAHARTQDPAFESTIASVLVNGKIQPDRATAVPLAESAAAAVPKRKEEHGSNENPLSEEPLALIGDSNDNSDASVEIGPVVVEQDGIQYDSNAPEMERLEAIEEGKVIVAGQLDNAFAAASEEEEFENARLFVIGESSANSGLDSHDHHSTDLPEEESQHRRHLHQGLSSSIPYIGLAINQNTELVYIPISSDKLLTCPPNLHGCMTSDLKLRKDSGIPDLTLLTATLAVDLSGSSAVGSKFSAVRYDGTNDQREHYAQTVVYAGQFSRLLYKSKASRAGRFPASTQMAINGPESSLYYLETQLNALVALEDINPKHDIVQRRVSFFKESNRALRLAVDDIKCIVFVGFASGHIIAVDGTTLDKKFSLPTERQARPKRMFVDPTHLYLYVLYEKHSKDHGRKSYILEYHLPTRAVTRKIVFADQFQILDFRVNKRNENVYLLVAPWGRSEFTIVKLGKQGQDVRSLKLNYYPTHWEVNFVHDGRAYGCIYATGKKNQRYHVKRYCP